MRTWLALLGIALVAAMWAAPAHAAPGPSVRGKIARDMGQRAAHRPVCRASAGHATCAACATCRAIVVAEPALIRNCASCAAVLAGRLGARFPPCDERADRAAADAEAHALAERDDVASVTPNCLQKAYRQHARNMSPACSTARPQLLRRPPPTRRRFARRRRHRRARLGVMRAPRLRQRRRASAQRQHAQHHAGELEHRCRCCRSMQLRQRAGNRQREPGRQ